MCVSSPYQVSVVGGAGALLGDAHAEAGQAAVSVGGAQVEKAGLTVGTSRAFHVHLENNHDV